MRKCLLLALVFLVSGAAFGAVELVNKGKPTAEIVIAKDAVQGVKLAAQDLQKHLELISGAKLRIVNAPSPDMQNQVYVGESEFTKKLDYKPTEFNNSGLEIIAKDNYVILDGPNIHWIPSPYQESRSDSLYLRSSAITGKTVPKPDNFPSPGLKKWQEFCGNLGAWYAVAELLEQLGVRWYMPYENGTVIPNMKTIAIPEQHLKKEAKFAKREWTYYGTMRSDGEGVAWLKRLKVGNNEIILFNHTTYAIYSSYEQQQLHPEYLAQDAKGNFILGYPSGRGIPRYTDPGFRKASVTYMRKVLDSQPDLSAIAIGTPDGGIKIDARDIHKYGKPADSIEQKTSNYLWDFNAHLARELKKSHPDKYLLYTNIAGARAVPTNIGEFPSNILFPPNIRPASLWGLDTHRKARLEKLRKWHAQMKTVRKAPAWDHWLSYRTPSRPRYPVIFTESLQNQMKEILPYVNGKFIEIQPQKFQVKGEKLPRRRLGMPGLVHLMVYWQNKLFWNPDEDRASMLDEYYKLFFGPAETQMREFYEFAENVWMRQESRSLTESTGFLKEVDVDKYFEILARARVKAGKGTVYDKRIAMIEKDMQSLKKLFPNLTRTGSWVRAYPTREPLKIDGDLSEYKYGWKKMSDWTTGEIPEKNLTRTMIALTPDKSAVIVGAICYENKMDQLKAECTVNDDFSIFSDDVIEVYINTPERSYFKIVVNTNGAIWDETTDVVIIDRDTLPILWNPGVKAAVKKFPDHWAVEIMIPTKDFGKLGPTKTYPWGIQVGRGGRMPAWTLAPTSGGPYKTMNRWARLWMR